MSIAEKIEVLIVDDQVTSRLLSERRPAQLGFKQITAAGDGEQGAQDHGPAAASSGHLRLQHAEDGRPWLPAARSAPIRPTKKAAFIMLTAQGDRALVQKAAQLGANNVLAKPFTIDKMKAAIEAVFGPLK